MSVDGYPCASGWIGEGPRLNGGWAYAVLNAPDPLLGYEVVLLNPLFMTALYDPTDDCWKRSASWAEYGAAC